MKQSLLPQVETAIYGEPRRRKDVPLDPLTTHLVLAPDASIDLQLHTTASDGVWTPHQLVDYLVSEQFALVAVTDHHRMDTIAQMQQIAAERQLPVLTGVEMSTAWNGKEIDVLCYGFDLADNALSVLAEAVVHRHLANVQEVSAQLHQKGYTFPRQKEVLQKVGGHPRHPNDLALLLQAHGYGSSPASVWSILHDAGSRWSTSDLVAVVDAAHRSGAVCMIAHPGKGGENHLGYDGPFLDQLWREAPIDGLEVYHPHHTSQQVALYLEYALEHHLLISSGSDSHGPHQPPVKYRAELSQTFLERVGIQVK